MDSGIQNTKQYFQILLLEQQHVCALRLENQNPQTRRQKEVSIEVL